MAVVTLTKNILLAYLPQIVELDALVLEELGEVYSEEQWGEKNFLFDLSGKWDYSRLALDEKNEPCGFWIASANPHPLVGVYTHRVAVKKESRRRGIAGQMFLDVFNNARQNGFKRMTLSVSVLNVHAIAFYETLGFKKLFGEELMEFVRHKELKAKVVDDYLQEETGHRKLIYALSM